MSAPQVDPTSLVDSIKVPIDDDGPSSASTSSFDGDHGSVKDISLDSDEGKGRRDADNTIRTSKASRKGPASVKQTTDSPTLSNLSIFKRPSLDDPTYYSQPKSKATIDVTSTTEVTGSVPSIASVQTTKSLQTKTTATTVKAAPRVHVRAPRSRAVNMEEDTRDPENINEVVKIKFEEVFAEPEGTYSFGTVWGASYRVFQDSKLWCYRFLSSACAVPCALCWGLHFACLTFCQIWGYQPCFRSFKVQVKPLARMYTVFVKSFIEPCYEAMALVLSKIRIHNSVD